MILAATGHRLHLMPGYRGDGSSPRIREALLEQATDSLNEWHPDLVISGMATGWDMAVAAAAMFLNIPYHAYIPFQGQHARWGLADQTMYRTLLEEAADVRIIATAPSKAAYIERDHAMVDAADRMLALFFGDETTGTGQTIAYAEGWLVPVTNVAEQFLTRKWPGHP